MKTEYKIISVIFAFMTVFGVGAFIGVKLQQEQPTPKYTQSDSLELVRIDSVKGIYQAEIDKQSAIAKSALKSAKLLSKSNAGLKAELNRLLNDTNATCEQRLSKSLSLNDSLQIEIDTLDVAVKALDIEAQTYSQKIYETEIQLGIEIRRNYTLSDSICKIKLFYEDSLLNINKRLYNGFIDRQFKLISNKYRKSVMQKATRN